MHKKLFSFFVIISLLLSLIGCAPEERIFLPEEERIVFIYLGNNQIEYQGNIYYHFSSGVLSRPKKYQYIGWRGSRLYRDFLYADAPDSPMFIFGSLYHALYIREDYDYTTDIFQIEGTDFTFCFGEHLSLTEEPAQYYPGQKCISIHSTSYPEVAILLIIAKKDGFFYAYEEGSGGSYFQDRAVHMSDAFIQGLKDHGIFE